MPQLQDPNFSRSVVLLVQHDEEASFGLVLNREVDLSLSDLFSSLGCPWRGGSEQRAAWGGPVSLDSGWMLFGETLSTPGESEQVNTVMQGVHLASSMDVFKRLTLDPPPQMRFFLYALFTPFKTYIHLYHPYDHSSIGPHDFGSSLLFFNNFLRFSKAAPY